MNPIRIPAEDDAKAQAQPKRRSTLKAGAVGGVVAGLIVTGVMVFGRDAGLLHETLAENAGDWLDRNFQTRNWAGDDGSELLERATHLAASASFGAAYGANRPLTRVLPPLMAGALFGAGLYAVAMARVAPRIGLTEGEEAASESLRAERFGLHLLFGVITAIVTDGLAPAPGKPPSNKPGTKAQA